MLKLTLFDKLKIMFDLMLDSPLFIFLFIFSILSLCILLDLKEKNKNVTKLSIAGVYLVLIIALIIKYHSSVLQTLDYFFDNLFIIFYFPNLAVYVVMIIISNILMFKNLFLDKKEPIRVISLCAYILIMYMMMLIIHTVGIEGLDVYDQASLYSNTNVLTLVELSNIIFGIWIIALLIDRIIFMLENKELIVTDRSKKRIVTRIVEKPVIQKIPVQIPVEKEVIREVQVPVEKQVIKEVIKEVPIEKEVIKEVKVEVPVEKEVIKEVIKEVPVEKEVIKEVPVAGKEIVKEVKVEVPVERIIYKDKEEDMFTKEDYIIMSEILKRIQKDMSK
jgi:hypothetical protein